MKKAYLETVCMYSKGFDTFQHMLYNVALTSIWNPFVYSTNDADLKCRVFKVNATFLLRVVESAALIRFLFSVCHLPIKSKMAAAKN